MSELLCVVRGLGPGCRHPSPPPFTSGSCSEGGGAEKNAQSLSKLRMGSSDLGRPGWRRRSRERQKRRDRRTRGGAAAAAQTLQVSWLSICCSCRHFLLCFPADIYCRTYPKFGKHSSTELPPLERGPSASGGASVGVTSASDDKGTRAKKHSHSVEEWALALRYAAKSSMKE